MSPDPEPGRRIDLHAHTCFSLRDGILTPRQLVRHARKLGLEGLAVTDHYDYDRATRGAFAARRAAEELGGLRVWPGLEYHARDPAGHLLVFLDDPEDAPPRGLTAHELHDWCDARDLLRIHPHPYGSFGIRDPQIIERSDYVELNGDVLPRANVRLREEAALRGWRLVAASDAHASGQLGSAWTEVPDVLDSLRDTLALGAKPVLAGRRPFGLAVKTARILAAPVAVPVGLVQIALVNRALARDEPAGAPTEGSSGSAQTRTPSISR